MNGDSFPLDLSAAIAHTQNFRNRLKSGSLPYKVPVQGYFLNRDSVMALLNQNNGDITGLKIYFAEKNDENGDPVLDIVVLGTYRDENTDCNDYGVPEEDGGSYGAAKDAKAPSALAGNEPRFSEARPCPHQCGKKNLLNSF